MKKILFAFICLTILTSMSIADKHYCYDAEYDPDYCGSFTYNGYDYKLGAHIVGAEADNHNTGPFYAWSENYIHTSCYTNDPGVTVSKICVDCNHNGNYDDDGTCESFSTSHAQTTSISCSNYKEEEGEEEGVKIKCWWSNGKELERKRYGKFEPLVKVSIVCPSSLKKCNDDYCRICCEDGDANDDNPCTEDSCNLNANDGKGQLTNTPFDGETTNGYCCSGSFFTDGECCIDADCNEGYKCESHKCSLLPTPTITVNPGTPTPTLVVTEPPSTPTPTAIITETPILITPTATATVSPSTPVHSATPYPCSFDDQYSFTKVIDFKIGNSFKIDDNIFTLTDISIEDFSASFNVKHEGYTTPYSYNYVNWCSLDGFSDMMFGVDPNECSLTTSKAQLKFYSNKEIEFIPYTFSNPVYTKYSKLINFEKNKPIYLNGYQITFKSSNEANTEANLEIISPDSIKSDFTVTCDKNYETAGSQSFLFGTFQILWDPTDCVFTPLSIQLEFLSDEFFFVYYDLFEISYVSTPLIEMKALNSSSGCENPNVINLTHYTASGFAFSPDQNFIAIGSSNEIDIYDTTSWQKINTLTGHHDYISSLAFNKDGSLLVSSSEDNKIKIWHTTNWTEANSLQNVYDIAEVSFNYDGSLLAVADGSYTDLYNYDNEKRYSVSFYETKNWKKILSTSGNKEIFFDIDFSKDNKFAFALKNKIILIDFNDYVTKKQRNVFEEFITSSVLITSLKLNKEGTLLACGTDDSRLLVWDTKNKKILFNETLDDYDITGIEFTNNERYMITGHEETTIRVIDTHTWEVILSFRCGEYNPYSWDILYSIPLLSPDKNYLTCGTDKYVNIWDFEALFCQAGKEMIKTSPTPTPSPTLQPTSTPIVSVLPSINPTPTEEPSPTIDLTCKDGTKNNECSSDKPKRCENGELVNKPSKCRCLSSDANCDDKDANGCEINLNNDVNNCGTCKNKCTTNSVCKSVKCESKQCITSNKKDGKVSGGRCCSGELIKKSNSCCAGKDCVDGYECKDNTCVEKDICGDGFCTGKESVKTCVEDCCKGTICTGNCYTEKGKCCANKWYDNSKVCCTDFDCKKNVESCCDHSCKKIECWTNKDCKAGFSCNKNENPCFSKCEIITTCTSGDNFCPEHCYWDDDSDCEKPSNEALCFDIEKLSLNPSTPVAGELFTITVALHNSCKGTVKAPNPVFVFESMDLENYGRITQSKSILREQFQLKYKSFSLSPNEQIVIKFKEGLLGVAENPDHFQLVFLPEGRNEFGYRIRHKIRFDVKMNPDTYLQCASGILTALTKKNIGELSKVKKSIDSINDAKMYKDFPKNFAYNIKHKRYRNAAVDTYDLIKYIEKTRTQKDKAIPAVSYIRSIYGGGKSCGLIIFKMGKILTAKIAQHNKERYALTYAHSPVNILIKNSNGETTGFVDNNTTVENINGSAAFMVEESKVILYREEDVELIVNGTGKGKASIEVIKTLENHDIKTIQYNNILVEEKLVAKLDIKKENMVLQMQIDNDGDGSFEKIKAPDFVEQESFEPEKNMVPNQLITYAAVLLVGIIIGALVIKKK